MKTHLDQPNDICPSCDVPYREHVGVAATCLALQRANKQIDELKEQLLKAVFQPLKVYVWKDFATDWSPGLAVAIAESKEQAIDMAKAEYSHNADFGGEPEVYPIAQVAFCVGGGS